MKDFPDTLSENALYPTFLEIVKPAKDILVFEAVDMEKVYTERAKAFQEAARSELRSMMAGSSRRADELDLKALRLADCAEDLINAVEKTVAAQKVAA